MGAIQDIARKDLKADQKGEADDEPKQPGMWAAFVGGRQAEGRLGPCQP